MYQVHGRTRWIGQLDLVGADELVLLGCALVTVPALWLGITVARWLVA